MNKKAGIMVVAFLILFSIAVIVSEWTLILIDRPEWSFPNYPLGIWIYILSGAVFFPFLWVITEDY